MNYDNPKACVFWDLEDFPFPSGQDQDMRNSLVAFNFRNDVSITAYVDEEKVADGLVDVYQNFGITILPVQGGKYARVHNILIDIVLWAMANPATYFKPLDLVVISANIKEDSDFLRALEALGDRYYNIILALPHELPSTNLPIVNSERFLLGIPDRGTFQRPLHEEKSIEETGPFPKGIPRLDPEDIYWARSEILVFWNVEDPISSTICDLSMDIDCGLRTKGYRGSVSLMAYTDNKEFTIRHQPYRLKKLTVLTKGDDGYAKATRMFLDMLFLVMNKDEPTHFIMISRTPKYMSKWANVNQALEARGSDVILGPSDAIQLPLSVDGFIRLCKDGPRYSPRVKEALELQEFSSKELCIFWVIEKFPSYPMSINFIFQSMEVTLVKKGYHSRHVSMIAYVNDEKLTKVDTVAGMTITLLPEGNKSTKVTRLLADMLLFAKRSSRYGTSLLVISEPFKDARFERVAKSLKGIGFNLLSAHLDYMVTFGTTLWSTRSIFDGTGYCQCDMCLANIGMDEIPGSRIEHSWIGFEN
ncbi:unnamed protein product [Arabis nemorensis]|uniref:NYN domain-containing protein n=1 Tax=Arabis nemorensis TaxID=586526 RepID=A0A565BXQ9_9BRAS|nr:unnamed protein product [Arabis nemorensis]